MTNATLQQIELDLLDHYGIKSRKIDHVLRTGLGVSLRVSLFTEEIIIYRSPKQSQYAHVRVSNRANLSKKDRQAVLSKIFQSASTGAKSADLN